MFKLSLITLGFSLYSLIFNVGIIVIYGESTAACMTYELFAFLCKRAAAIRALHIYQFHFLPPDLKQRYIDNIIKH